MRRLTGAELRPQARRHLSFRPSAVASHTKTPPQVKPAGFSNKKVYPATLTGRLRQAGCRSQHRGCGVPGIERGSSRKPPSRRLRSCVAAGLHTKGHMWCRCASRLTDTAYSPDYQIFGRERRQCKVVRRDALHAPTPRSALPRLQPGKFPEDVWLFIILRRRGGRAVFS